MYILKGKIHIGEEGWSKFLEEALIPTLGLLQCIAASNSQLAQCVTKMLDPDVYESINLPYIEVIKGNSRLLYSSDSKLREEALCRLIFLLGCEKDSSKKLPRLSSLHGLPLSSLCIIERSHSGFKRSEGNYQVSFPQINKQKYEKMHSPIFLASRKKYTNDEPTINLTKIIY